MEPFVIVIISVIALLLFLGGAVQTFKRQPIVAALVLIFLTPFWMVWAVVESFLEDPSKKETPEE